MQFYGGPPERPRGRAPFPHRRIGHPRAGDGEFVVRARTFARPYSGAMTLQVICGEGCVGDDGRHRSQQVIESRHDSTGWRLRRNAHGGATTARAMAMACARSIRVMRFGLSRTVGMPGVTAWIGLNEHGRPAGETVVFQQQAGGRRRRRPLANCKAAGRWDRRRPREIVTSRTNSVRCVRRLQRRGT